MVKTTRKHTHSFISLDETVVKRLSILGLLIGRVIIGIFGFGCAMELFGWVVMGSEVKWVGMGWVAKQIRLGWLGMG